MGACILPLVPEVKRKTIGQDTRSRAELDIQPGEPIRGQLSASGRGALLLRLARAGRGIQTIRHRPGAPEA
jgi:hypothetical protein